MARERLSGMVERITYHNEETTYTVLQLSDDAGKKFTAVGKLPAVQPGERLEMTGEWRLHPRYGVQFHVETFASVPPATTEAIERYLASGLVKGVGPATAKRLVEAFGEDTLEVIAEQPHLLTEVPGIGPKKAAAIAQAASQQKDLRTAILFLQGLGVSLTYALRIFKRYGAETVQRVRENPYRLADEIYGIGFRRADEIARALGISPKSPVRIQAAVRYVLSQAASEGHVYLPLPELTERLQQLDISDEELPQHLEDLAGSGRIVVENTANEQRIFLGPLYHAEVEIARRLRLLLQHAKAADVSEIRMSFDRVDGVTLSAEQKQAVERALRYGCLVITGGPGTGKTTVVRAICHAFTELGSKVALAAPTGRAAHRLSEATGRSAQTLHRLLEVRNAGDVGRALFARNADKPLEVDVVIVDEASMLDTFLLQSLLVALRPGTRLLLIGDEDQLPSVGPGQVLADILSAGQIPVVRLTQVFRQASVSLIVENAHRIRAGKVPLQGRSDQDFFFLDMPPDAVPGELAELVGRRLPRFLGGDPITDIQVLTPVRRGPLGVEALNKLLQSELNPSSGPVVSVGDRELRARDKVMQIRNNYDTMVFNGDIGRVVRVIPDERAVEVAFADDGDERIVRYAEDELDQLTHAYAISVHKSQGSEYPCVVMPISWVMPALMTRNLLYTAVTRARKLVVLLGERRALTAYVRNKQAANRFSGLKDRLLAAAAADSLSSG